MDKTHKATNHARTRRSFLKNGVLAGGVAAIGAGVTGARTLAFGQRTENRLPTPGDIAILRFLAAAELIESDLWTQYAELGGIGNNPPIEVDPNEPLNNYQVALSNLDSDAPQYITSSHTQTLIGRTLTLYRDGPVLPLAGGGAGPIR